MKIVIDEEICKKKGLSLPCVLAILMVKTGANVEEIFQNLKESEVIVEENTLMGTQRYITQRWSDLCDDILLTSDDYVPDDARIENLAKSLMEGQVSIGRVISRTISSGSRSSLSCMATSILMNRY